ncbi:hypothetical protein PKB_1189 [Pseudomonas knackmussii B13]|uniref:Uncharacterized protein n=1 Tax=Pseudomonas knackmussii (strain DSM 6978 / CCUG 54928 / LMG 23759 / B13) TaxID=1301098 RepID=A0A024HDA1_PSEKB|nr:alpha-2,8-polysialyltransferase family protein [Pseudomonas knackmussii]CDF82554.1 hypothetical protein PKB_1189 [Pseudomonas knackmussii B13]
MSLFIIGSPWHAALANAIIEREEIKNPSIIVEEISSSSLEQILGILKHPTLAIFQHENTRFESIKKLGIFRFIRNMHLEFERIENSCKYLNQSQTRKVYYFNFYSPITRKIIKSLPKALSKREVIRVEDGICDYFEFNFINHKKPLLLIKNILATLLIKSDLYRRRNSKLENKTSSYYCFFPEKITQRWKSKKLIALLEYATEIRKNFSITEEAIVDDSESLIIGQTLFEDGIATLEQEVRLYKTASDTLPGPVKLKAHPRTTRLKRDAIRAAGIEILETKFPAENLIATRPYHSIVGMWSNTVIYSAPLFHIRSFTMNHHLIEQLSTENSHLKKIHQTLSEKFPEFYIDYRVKMTSP